MNLSKYVLLTFLMFTGLQVSAKNLSETKTISDAELKKFSQSLRWQRLLYYNKNNRSEIDDPLFFLSEKGKSSPLEELKENYRQMFVDQSLINDEHAICKFPARFYFLNKEFGLNDYNKIRQCPKLLDFLMRSNGQSVSLVFSSYHINNPSSAFGHTFLKINKHDRKDLDLLNYGINYAATTTKDNIFAYVFKGLVGHYKGEHSAVPFYYKIREYSDFESRDIWEYELNLSVEETELLILHFWELGRGWSWYYFLDGNCSYWALKVLQAISLKLNFDHELDVNLVIPAETLKALNKYPDLIREVYYRPSLRKQFVYSYELLSKKDQKTVRKLSDDVFSQKIKDKSELTKYNVDVLNSALQFYDYKYAYEYVLDEDATLRKKQPLLLARSSKSEKATKVEIPRPERPDKIHPPARVGIGYQNSKEVQSYDFNYKMGFHELYDSSIGIDSSMAINYLDISARAFKYENSEDWDFKFQKLDFIRVDSLNAFTNFELTKSWRIKVGLNSSLYEQSFEKLVGYFQGDLGLAFALFDNNQSMFYFLMSNTLEANGRFHDGFRLGVAPIIGLKLNWTKNLVTLLEGKHHWFYQTSGLWQRQLLLETQTQWYLPSLKSAFYLKSLSYNLTSDSFEDHGFEVGLRHFF